MQVLPWAKPLIAFGTVEMSNVTGRSTSLLAVNETTKLPPASFTLSGACIVTFRATYKGKEIEKE